MTHPGTLMDAAALGQLLGISRSSIYRRRTLGQPLPPAIALGPQTLRWRSADVDAWLIEQTEPREAAWLTPRRNQLQSVNTINKGKA